MPLYYASLNSGSNGNCYYVGNAEEAVLIDAGISCRETEKRMRSLSLNMNAVKALFITHEHGDHIRGLTGLAQKYQIPVYLSQQTALRCGEMANHGLCNHIQAEQSISVGKLLITAFSKAHDAADPFSYVVAQSGTHVGVFTDIGKVCDRLQYYFNQCQAAFLEANYDTSLLENGRYPTYLKQRIKGGSGHLSNEEALSLFVSHRSDSFSRIILAHLSKENNTPHLVQHLFTEAAGKIDVYVASRDTHSELFSLNLPEELSDQNNTAVPKALQLALFS